MRTLHEQAFPKGRRVCFSPRGRLVAEAGVGIELPGGGIAIINVTAPRGEDAKRIVEWIYENGHLALSKRLGCWACYGHHTTQQERQIVENIGFGPGSTVKPRALRKGSRRPPRGSKASRA